MINWCLWNVDALDFNNECYETIVHYVHNMMYNKDKKNFNLTCVAMCQAFFKSSSVGVPISCHVSDLIAWN